jgi:hypothetical protein
MNIKPGQQVKISEHNGRTVHAEMSCKGDVIRYVRTERNGSFEVIKTIRVKYL